MRRVALTAILLAASLAGISPAISEPANQTVAGWPYYGGDAGGSRYSPLAQISRDNVTKLAVAWEYHTGDVSDGSDGRRKSAFETTPIVVDGTMYLTTPFNRVIALDPETGQEKWSFDPKIDLRGPYSEGLINRGVTLWTDAAKKNGDACRQRVFLATIDAQLFAPRCRDRQALRGFRHRWTCRSDGGHRQHHPPRRVRGNIRAGRGG